MSEAATPVMPFRQVKPDAPRPSEADRSPAPAADPNGMTQPASNPTGNGVHGQIAELRVSGHLMALETGLFCVFQAPGGPSLDPSSGLPGVRISLPPGITGRPEAVSISTFRQDGWLSGAAALVRVTDGPAQILVTVYQSPRGGEPAPRLQVLRLSADPGIGTAVNGAVANGSAGTAAQIAATSPMLEAQAAEPEVVAHVQRTGDVGVRFGEWVGSRGSKLWVEGFGVSPLKDVPAEDIEYQAVLGRGWLSPWVEAGKFCGSRGMALPLLGLRLRLKGEAAKRYECTYSGTFTDGTTVGPVAGGESCEAESLAALEAFLIELRPKKTVQSPPRKTGKPTPAGKSATAAQAPAAAAPAKAAPKTRTTKPR